MRQIRSANLRKVFSPEKERQLNAALARLCVLYEDLRVEICGIEEYSIPVLDILDLAQDNKFAPERIGRYRRYYFVRRSIGTIREFAEALRMINGDADLRIDAMTRRDGAREMWDAAVAFFDDNEERLGKIRNDIGGHVGHAAALNAIDSFGRDSFSTIELVDGDEFRLQFAGEIAASAILPHLDNDDIQAYETLLRECIMPAYRHAARCVQLLVIEYLWPRFGG
jgi:hypothetical protein